MRTFLLWSRSMPSLPSRAATDARPAHPTSSAPSRSHPRRLPVIRKDIIEAFRVPPGEVIRLKDYNSGWAQTGEMEELEADSVILALGQEADLSLLDGVPGLEVEDGVVKVDLT